MGRGRCQRWAGRRELYLGPLSRAERIVFCAWRSESARAGQTARSILPGHREVLGWIVHFTHYLLFGDIEGKRSGQIEVMPFHDLFNF